jgi:hypothetical protein
VTVAAGIPPATRRRLALVLFAVAAGTCDAATGLALLAAPQRVLQFLGVPWPGGDPFALRFVGVFVGCVGLAYLAPFLGAPGPRREKRLRAAIELTAGFRLAVALFLGAAVTLGQPVGWLLVGSTDAALGLAQLVLLARGFFGDGD